MGQNNKQASGATKEAENEGDVMTSLCMCTSLFSNKSYYFCVRLVRSSESLLTSSSGCAPHSGTIVIPLSFPAVFLVLLGLLDNRAPAAANQHRFFSSIPGNLPEENLGRLHRPLHVHRFSVRRCSPLVRPVQTHTVNLHSWIILTSFSLQWWFSGRNLRLIKTTVSLDYVSVHVLHFTHVLEKK